MLSRPLLHCSLVTKVTIREVTNRTKVDRKDKGHQMTDGAPSDTWHSWAPDTYKKGTTRQ